MLEIKNLLVKLEEEDKQIMKGVNLTVEAGKVHDHGAERLWQIHAVLCALGQRGL